MTNSSVVTRVDFKIRFAKKNINVLYLAKLVRRSENPPRIKYLCNVIEIEGLLFLGFGNALHGKLVFPSSDVTRALKNGAL